jgi:regulator of nonsense transcripts 2
MKRSSSIWNESRPFPKDMDYLITDTLEAVRPKLQLAQSYEEAQEAANKLDAEFRAKLGE